MGVCRRERLVALQRQLEAATQARADSEGTQAQWQRREAELYVIRPSTTICLALYLVVQWNHLGWV